MRKELDEALCAKYPLIFKDRNAPMTHTAMCWGFDCGDGWYNLIDVLCGMLYSEYSQAKSRYEYVKETFETNGGETHWGKPITVEEIEEKRLAMEEAAKTVPVASQVKEKFGGLRFYVNGATEKHYNYITFAESMSYRTCEVCGAPGKTYTDGWHTTLCETHAKEQDRTEEYQEENDE
jgi:hypothetical protein